MVQRCAEAEGSAMGAPLQRDLRAVLSRFLLAQFTALP